MADEGSDKPYRLCEIGQSGHSSTPERELMFGSDAEAIAAAEAVGFGTKGELWDGHRLIAQLEERAA